MSDKISEAYIDELLKEIENVPFDKSAFQIEHMVSSNETPERSYQKTMLQLETCIRNIKEAKFVCLEIENDIAELKHKHETERNRFEKKRHEINIERKEWTLRSQAKMIKECFEQIGIYKSILNNLPKPNRADFEMAEKGYWHKRFLKDAIREMKAHGRIQVGTQAALESVGIKFDYDPKAIDGIKWHGVSNEFHLERVQEKQLFLDKTIDSVQQKLDEINPYVAVLLAKRNPEEPEATDWKKMHYPNGMAIKFGSVTGPQVERNRQKLLEMAIEAKSKYAFFVDSDQKLNTHTISKFVNYMDANEDVTMLSAITYHKGTTHPVGMNIVNGTVRPIQRNQGVVDCNWCSGLPAVIIRVSDLAKINMPYFDAQRDPNKEPGVGGNENLIIGEDTYFCRKLLDAGLKIKVDTDEFVEHIKMV